MGGGGLACAAMLKTEEARKALALRASLILAAIYSRGAYRPTTIDVLMFHFRVRNGAGWGHQAVTTRFQGRVFLCCFPACPGVTCGLLRGGVCVLAGGGRLASAWRGVGEFDMFFESCLCYSAFITGEGD